MRIEIIVSEFKNYKKLRGIEMLLNEKQMTRFNQELSELYTIPKRVDLLIKLLNTSAGLRDNERKLIIDALDKSIILSLWKVVDKYKAKLDTALKRLEKENEKLHEKIMYVKTARNQAIAHLDSVKKIEKLNSQIDILGTSPLEIRKSYEDIIEWILKFIEFKKYIRTYNKVNSMGLTESEIDRESEYEIFKAIILTINF